MPKAEIKCPVSIGRVGGILRLVNSDAQRELMRDGANRAVRTILVSQCSIVSQDIGRDSCLTRTKFQTGVAADNLS